MSGAASGAAPVLCSRNVHYNLACTFARRWQGKRFLVGDVRAEACQLSLPSPLTLLMPQAAARLPRLNAFALHSSPHPAGLPRSTCGTGAPPTSCGPTRSAWAGAATCRPAPTTRVGRLGWAAFGWTVQGGERSYLWPPRVPCGPRPSRSPAPLSRRPRPRTAGAPLLQSNTQVGLASGPGCDGTADDYGAFVKLADKGVLEQVRGLCCRRLRAGAGSLRGCCGPTRRAPPCHPPAAWGLPHGKQIVPSRQPAAPQPLTGAACHCKAQLLTGSSHLRLHPAAGLPAHGAPLLCPPLQITVWLNSREGTDNSGLDDNVRAWLQEANTYLYGRR